MELESGENTAKTQKKAERTTGSNSNRDEIDLRIFSTNIFHFSGHFKQALR